MSTTTEFIGANKRGIDYSINVVRFIDPALTHGESDLFETKWWDYRILHPMEATFLFTHYYVEAAKRCNERRVGANNVRRTTKQGWRTTFKPLKHINLLRCSDVARSGMWKARRKADMYGIPYDFWCEWAMKYADKCDWLYIPKPQQMYATGGKGKGEEWFVSMIDFITTAWVEKCKTEVVVAEDEFYKVENVGSSLHRYQGQHQRYLMDCVDKTANKEILLASLLYKSRVLLPQLVTVKYGASNGGEMLRRAKMFA